MTVVIVTGEVGAGKTTLAKKLAAQLNYQYLDVSEVIIEDGLDEDYDVVRKCTIVDPNKLAVSLMKIVKSGNYVVDGHMSQLLPPKVVDLCIVVTCTLLIQEGRLKRRGYTDAKVKENVQSNVFETSLNESKEIGHKVMVVDTSKDFNIKQILNQISGIMSRMESKK